MSKIKMLVRLVARFGLGARLYESIQFRRHTGYKLNLNEPRTFNEKVCARKLDLRFTDAITLQDKVAVRDLVRDRVGEEYLTKLYDVVSSPSSLRVEDYPGAFVIKASNACGPESLFLCPDKSVLDKRDIEIAASRIYSRYNRVLDRFYYYSNEWWYGRIRTRLMVEEFLSDGEGIVPLDYKFYVFGGRVEYIQVDLGRFVNHTRALYTRDWRRVRVAIGYPNGPDVERPVRLSEMIDVAERIGHGYGYLRVDLYSLKEGRIKFGEVTIAPSLGHARIDPVSFDRHLGDLWKEGAARVA